MGKTEKIYKIGRKEILKIERHITSQKEINLKIAEDHKILKSYGNLKLTYDGKFNITKDDVTIKTTMSSEIATKLWNQEITQGEDIEDILRSPLTGIPYKPRIPIKKSEKEKEQLKIAKSQWKAQQKELMKN